MQTDTIVALLGGGGIAAIISAVVAGLFSKRKLGAEATEIITKAAAGVVTNMQAEIDRLIAAAAQRAIDHHQQMTDLMRLHEDEIEEIRKVLQLHVAWDTVVKAECERHGITLPPVPPLLPPRRLERPELPGLPEGV